MNYRDGEADWRRAKFRDQPTKSLPESPDGRDYERGSHKIVKQGANRNYKTKLCRHFEIGKCKLGGLCNFSHNESEVRKEEAERGEVRRPLTHGHEPQGSVDVINELRDRLEAFAAQQKAMLKQLSSFCNSSELTKFQPNVC